jgi:hypothetical protein
MAIGYYGQFRVCFALAKGINNWHLSPRCYPALVREVVVSGRELTYIIRTDEGDVTEQKLGQWCWG